MQQKNIKSENMKQSMNPIATLKKSQLESYDELESYKKIRKKRKRKAIERVVVWALVVLLMPIFLFAFVVIINPNVSHNFFGYKFFVVTSESMKPVFDKGDMIVVKKVKSVDELQIGTDISFIRASDGKIVTHRILDRTTNEKGEIEFVTKGVHNPNADYDRVSYSEVLGKKVAVWHVMGQFISFFRTPPGIITFLAIFVAIIMIFTLIFRYSNDIRAVGVN